MKKGDKVEIATYGIINDMRRTCFYVIEQKNCNSWKYSSRVIYKTFKSALQAAKRFCKKHGLRIEE